MPPSERLTLHVVPDLPLVQPGDDLAALLAAALERARIPLRDGDVIVVAQKVVSKAQGHYIDLAEVVP